MDNRKAAEKWFYLADSLIAITNYGDGYFPSIMGYPILPDTNTLDISRATEHAHIFRHNLAVIMGQFADTLSAQIRQSILKQLMGNDTAGVVSSIIKDPWDSVSLAALADMIEEKRGETVEAERIRTMIASKRSILVLEQPEGSDNEGYLDACNIISKLAGRLGCDWLVIPRNWRAYVVNPKENNP